MEPCDPKWPPGQPTLATTRWSTPWSLPSPQPLELRSAHSRIKVAQRGASRSPAATQICLPGPTKEIMGLSFSRNPRPLGWPH